MKRTPFFSLVLLSATAFGQAVDVPTPVEIYGELFEAVQLGGVFPDNKTFVDALPKAPPRVILADFAAARRNAGFDLRSFVESHFTLPADVAKGFQADPHQDVRGHIDALWSVLERSPDGPSAHSSLLPLPHRYVVPGGRFREIYYWDSYFTMLGLEQSGRHDLAVDMVRNFAFLIDRYGHIPNGNRSYYLSRSQPPFFAAMVTLIAQRDGEGTYVQFLPQLAKEYEFWMEGAATLKAGDAHRRVVKLRDGTVLNRHWDDRATPREESYRHDVDTARDSRRPAAEVYRNLRAAAESGWDFSSRWLADGRTLATIRTTELLPADLNSLLYGLEQTLAHAYRVSGQPDAAARIGARAWERRAAIQKYLWNPSTGIFGDYAWKEERPTDHVTAATLYPLFFGVATLEQGERVADTVGRVLLQPDGLATTVVNTGQQWDAPNGWAPLQWIAIKGLNDYGHAPLAQTIARRWIQENVSIYAESGKLVEKYDVTGDAAASGGEYPLQDGFGWTNGVLRQLLAMYPQFALARADAVRTLAAQDAR